MSANGLEHICSFCCSCIEKSCTACLSGAPENKEGRACKKKASCIGPLCRFTSGCELIPVRRRAAGGWGRRVTVYIYKSRRAVPKCPKCKTSAHYLDVFVSVYASSVLAVGRTSAFELSRACPQAAPYSFMPHPSFACQLGALARFPACHYAIWCLCVPAWPIASSGSPHACTTAGTFCPISRPYWLIFLVTC